VPVSAWSRREERWVKESSEEEAPLLSPTVRRWASCMEMCDCCLACFGVGSMELQKVK